MDGRPQDQMTVGLVHFMAFPGAAGGQRTLQAFDRVCEDDYFGALEVTSLLDACLRREAIERVKDHSYDAIILDMLMPGIDGLETLKRLREDKPDLQIILLTGHATLEKGIKAMKLGALEILEKPADIQTLLNKISEARSNRILLVEKRAEELVKDILKRKGW